MKIKIIALLRFVPTGKSKFQKNNKKIQKLKNTVAASFQAIIGWKMLRKRENKNYRSVSFLPDGQEKIPKKKQKNSKYWKIPLRLHSKPKYVGKFWEREKIKIIAPFRSFPTGKRKFQKNSKNIHKIEKYHYVFIPNQNRLEKAEK